MRALDMSALILTALSLAPSFAHVLEAPPRLSTWSPELWREVTVFNGQYRWFGLIGGPLDGAAVFITAALAFAVRHEALTFRWAVSGAVFFALALAAWGLIVSPVNAILAKWTPGLIPANFRRVQARWEMGHMIVAALKFVGFSAVAFSIVRDFPSR